jgi:hypothetical protein
LHDQFDRYDNTGRASLLDHDAFESAKRSGFDPNALTDDQVGMWLGPAKLKAVTKRIYLFFTDGHGLPAVPDDR